MVEASPPAPNYMNSSEDFEKWIRMATDNKINTQNSWDLALIDYFHDLSLLRDGDGINFQKASATLDGCVKIYSSRVDSAVTETGRLINGLAVGKAQKDIQGESDDDDDEDEENNDLDPEAPTKSRRKTKASNLKDTLVEFSAIKIKKMDLELYVDPIFKKALTDFDEGGSKSLLLNMLKVNEDQKVVFDTTESADVEKVLQDIDEDDEEDEATEKHDDILDGINDDEDELHNVEKSFAVMDIDEEPLDEDNDENLISDIMALGEKYFGNSHFDSLSVCPSLKDLKGVLNQETTSTDLLKGLESIPLNITSNYSDSSQLNYDVSFGDLGDGGGDFDDIPPLDPNDSKYPGNRTSIFFNDLEEEADDYGNTMRSLFHENKSFTPGLNDDDNEDGVIVPERESILNIPDEELLAYFDENQRKQWAGPDHWKVQRIKKNYNVNAINEVPRNDDNQSESQSKKRKQKEPFFINFLSDEFPEEDIIFSESETTPITLPKKEWISKTKNVLPNDMHFTTRNFIYLFNKRKLINSNFNKLTHDLDKRIDETFYAENISNAAIPDLNNQDFFNDDVGGGDVSLGGFSDDYDDNNNGPSQSDSIGGSQQLLSKSFGSQGPLSYSRVSKKVDVKLLKDNLWDTLNQERSTRKSLTTSNDSLGSEEVLKFSEVVSGLTTKYDAQVKNDLSTSFCFICLLHLANENGFTIMNNDDNSDLIIQNFQQ